MEILALVIAAFIAYNIMEYTRHQGRVKSVPVRIHVNGSRGKSSVVRLIAGGLRNGGYRTLAKTTGTLPRIILPDGTEIPVLRHRVPSIYEQIRFFRFAKKLRPDAIVIECMAVQPTYQWITEHTMIRSTHGVITNVRPDHIPEMGTSPEQIARSLANTVPRNGELFIGDKHYFHLFKKVADGRKSTLILPSEYKPDASMLNAFPYREHPSNVSLALQVCQSLGVSRGKAFQGMINAIPDPGVLRNIIFRTDDQELTVVNAFAANDPESTRQIWEMSGTKHYDTSVVLLNTRIDRVDRSLQLVRLIRELNPDCVILMGSRSRKVRRGLNNGLAVYENWGASPDDIFSLCKQLSGKKGIIFAMGNMGGGGFEFINYIDSIRSSLVVEM